MTPERWLRAKAIFQRALDLPASERAALLACEPDDGIRAEAEGLLNAHERDAGFSLGTEHLPHAQTAEELPTLRLVREPSDLTGTTIDDTYRILGVLGRGGMGIVYLAEHVHLHDRVAVKVLPGATSERAEAVLRFLREGRMARAIRHANIVSVLELRTAADGVTYMVMDFVEGETLREFMRRRGPIKLDETVRILTPIAEALDHAHGLGIVHRDLKPENVMVGGTPEAPIVKLLDLGLARLFESNDPATPATNLTIAGQVLGTPAYMSPEQWGQLPEDGGAEIDARADVYSFGVMLYEIVAGRPPFEGDTVHELRVAHTRNTPQPLADRVDGLPVAASEAVARALAKDRSARPASAGALLAEIRGETAATHRVRVKGDWASDTARLWAVALSVAAVALVVGLGWAIYLGLSFAGKLPGTTGAEPKSVPTATIQRALSIRLTTRRTRDGVTTIEPFVPSGSIVFGDDDGVRFELSSPNGGWLYVINEAPTLEPSTALPRYLVIFPKPDANGGSPQLESTGKLTIPETSWIEFSGAAGSETVWIVWSDRPVDALAGIERFVTPELKGRVSDAATTEAIRSLVGRGQAANGALEWENGVGRARPGDDGEMVVVPIRFNHRGGRGE